ncbi:MAG: membrane protein insertion efficiency factor YidD [Bacteroidetes bacterium]|nr:membrane protein insertion efficiency factor YidD [Bacteroidota bacterium]
MRYLLLLLIKIYWILPKAMRRRCIFRENCSQYVYRCSNDGFFVGMRALVERICTCRQIKGYVTINNTEFVILSNFKLEEKSKMKI